MKHSRASQRGMTLIEIGMAIFLAALLVGVAVPTLRSVTGAKAREEVGKLAANIRATRGTAAVSARTCRMVFDLDEHAYGVECADGLVQIARERAVQGARDERDERRDRKLTDQEKEQQRIVKKASFATDERIKPQSFSDLEFVSVFTSHQEEKYTKGKAYLYFFPSGAGERANIQVRHGDDYYSLHVSPLSGRVQVFNERVELKKIRDED